MKLKEEDGKNECQVEEMSEEENARQCEVLKRQKENGPERQSPQFPAISRNFPQKDQGRERQSPQFPLVEKKTDHMFRCVPCNFEFKTEINLVKHRATLHAMTPDSISNAVDGAKTFADVVKVPETTEVASKIPVVTSSVSTARSVVQQSRMEMWVV